MGSELSTCAAGLMTLLGFLRLDGRLTHGICAIVSILVSLFPGTDARARTGPEDDSDVQINYVSPGIRLLATTVAQLRLVQIAFQNTRHIMLAWRLSYAAGALPVPAAKKPCGEEDVSPVLAC